MLHVVIFEDAPNSARQRRNHMEAHLAFLEANANTIRSAGPLSDPDDGAGKGGLWIVDASSADAVKRMVQTDPFMAAGVRQSFVVYEWRQVFKDGSRVG